MRGLNKRRLVGETLRRNVLHEMCRLPNRAWIQVGDLIPTQHLRPGVFHPQLVTHALLMLKHIALLQLLSCHMQIEPQIKFKSWNFMQNGESNRDKQKHAIWQCKSKKFAFVTFLCDARQVLGRLTKVLRLSTSRSKKSYAQTFRSLNTWRSWLLCLCTSGTFGQEKCCARVTGPSVEQKMAFVPKTIRGPKNLLNPLQGKSLPAVWNPKDEFPCFCLNFITQTLQEGMVSAGAGLQQKICRFLPVFSSVVSSSLGRR